MEGVQGGVALSPQEIQELKQRLEQLRRASTELELAEISKKLSIAVRQDEVRKLKEQLVAVEKIQVDQAKLVELTKMGELAKLSVDEALKSKLVAVEAEIEKVAVEKKLREVVDAALKVKDVAAQRGILGTTTQSGTGNFIWTNNDERVEMTWTGGFRLSADDRDIEWIEPGKSLRISDGNWLTATGVEIKGRRERDRAHLLQEVGQAAVRARRPRVSGNDAPEADQRSLETQGPLRSSVAALGLRHETREAGNHYASADDSAASRPRSWRNGRPPGRSAARGRGRDNVGGKSRPCSSLTSTALVSPARRAAASSS
jgi:hypothetical protein